MPILKCSVCEISHHDESGEPVDTDEWTCGYCWSEIVFSKRDSEETIKIIKARSTQENSER